MTTVDFVHTAEVAEEVNKLSPPIENPPSVEDIAAHDYQKLLPEFYTAIDDLSNRQLKKVIQAVMEYPLERIDFQWSYEKEKKAFILGTKILDCRFVLIRAVLEMKQEEIKQLLNSETKKETVVVDQT